MIDTRETLREITEKHASDIFITADHPLTYKAHGQFLKLNEITLAPSDTKGFVDDIYHLAGNRDMGRLTEVGEDDFSFTLESVSRFRVNAYRQRGTYAAVIRIIPSVLPDPSLLGIPEEVLSLSALPSGLLIFTGAAGSGRSITLACLIDRINETRRGHIITIEDPIEFLHPHKGCIISQREVLTDTKGYAAALRSALRESPDVIMVGEFTDPEVIRLALIAAESGHLVLSSMHTRGAKSTVDRILHIFPSEMRQLRRSQLSDVLSAVVFQELSPAKDGTLTASFTVEKDFSALFPNAG